MSLLTRKVRGFRVVDLIGVGVLVAIILGVYLAKTVAGRERAEIAQVDRHIRAEKTRIRLLKAEVAHLEQPGRLERLATVYLDLTPVTAGREATVSDLPRLAAGGPPPKAKAPSAVAALVNGEGVTPGVPPPPPSETAPVQLAEAKP
jgi:hypothetical protein